MPILCGADCYAIAKDFAGPIATICAAVAAAFVAYRLGKGQLTAARAQAEVARLTWQTTNEKVVIDLMEKRAGIYEGVRSIIGEVSRHGTAPQELVFRYMQAIDRGPYFFGEEVTAYLEQLRRQLIELDHAVTMLAAENQDANWADRRMKTFLAVTKFYEDAPRLFAPYIKAHQKA